MYQEKRIAITSISENQHLLYKYRQDHAPYLKAFVQEMKKRLEQKRVDKRTNLTKGRLSTKLTALWTDERPKPFYKKMRQVFN